MILYNDKGMKFVATKCYTPPKLDNGWFGRPRYLMTDINFIDGERITFTWDASYGTNKYFEFKENWYKIPMQIATDFSEEMEKECLEYMSFMTSSYVNFYTTNPNPERINKRIKNKINNRRDSQRKKVYDFDCAIRNKFLGWNNLPIKDCSTIVDSIIKVEKANAVKVELRTRKKKGACYSPRENLIIFSGYCRDTVAVVHETAHALHVFFRYKFQDYSLMADHGPEYMAVYIYLLNKYYNIDKEDMLDMAHILKVQVNAEIWNLLNQK